jgi:hypothetical protein
MPWFRVARYRRGCPARGVFEGSPGIRAACGRLVGAIDRNVRLDAGDDCPIARECAGGPIPRIDDHRWRIGRCKSLQIRGIGLLGARCRQWSKTLPAIGFRPFYTLNSPNALLITAPAKIAAFTAPADSRSLSPGPAVSKRSAIRASPREFSAKIFHNSFFSVHKIPFD